MINVNIIKVFGDVDVEFRFCEEDVGDCLSLRDYENASKLLKPINSGIVGLKATYKL